MKVHLEYKDQKSSKFWEVEVTGSEVTVRYGRIGTTGQTKTKDHGSNAKAKAEAEKQVSSKLKKGYAKVTSSAKKRKSATVGKQAKPKTREASPKSIDALVKKAGRAAKNESFEQATSRASLFLQGLIDLGIERKARDSLNQQNMYTADKLKNLSTALESCAKAKPIPPGRRKAIAAAEKRLGHSLPPSLVDLWGHLAVHQTLLRGFLVRKVIEPEQLLQPPKWASDARLAAVVPRIKGGDYSDLREVFSDEYLEWFEETDKAKRVSKPSEAKKVKADKGAMIDPALAELHIPIAEWHNETCFVAVGLADKKGEAPVLSHNDDDEGYCFLEGRDCRDWFSQETTRAIKALGERLIEG